VKLADSASHSPPAFQAPARIPTNSRLRRRRHLHALSRHSILMMKYHEPILSNHTHSYAFLSPAHYLSQ